MKKVLFLILLFVIKTTSAYTPKEFSLNTFNSNESVTLKSLKGKKTLINFWATWCTSCVQEIPELHSLKKSSKSSQYNFIAISAGDSEKKVKKFIKRYKFNYKILMDKNSKVTKNWGIDSLPVTIVLGEDGSIIYSDTKPPQVLP